MIVDNAKQIDRFQITRLSITISVLAVILFFVINEFPTMLTDTIRLPLITVLSIGYIIYSLITMLRNVHFVFFSDVGDTILLRFYSVKIFKTNRRAIEIKKDKFAYFKYETSLLGLRKNLILYQQKDNSVVKYPSISLSCVRKDDIKRIIKSLELLTPKSN